MKLLGLLLCLVFAQLTYGAGIFVEGGLARTERSISINDSSSKFVGWGHMLGGGLGIPFNKKYGLTLGAEWCRYDLNNDASTRDFLEKATLDSYAARVGLYAHNFTLGYGMGTDELKLTLSQTSGFQEQTFSGDSSEVFLRWENRNAENLRPVLEFQYNVGHYGILDSVGWTGFLRLKLGW